MNNKETKKQRNKTKLQRNMVSSRNSYSYHITAKALERPILN